MLKKGLTIAIGIFLGLGALSTALIIGALIAAISSQSPGMYLLKDAPKPSIDDPMTMLIPGSPAQLATSIIRLTDSKDRGLCSAFVVSDQYAITAAHCIETPSDIILVNGKEKTKVAAFNRRTDYALLLGDFKEYAKLVTDVSTARFPMLSGTQAIACGYPEGSHQSTCAPQILVANAGFYIASKGQLYPGMSGGPLLIMPAPGVVFAIGVNHAVSDQETPDMLGFDYFADIVGIWGNFNLEVTE